MANFITILNEVLNSMADPTDKETLCCAVYEDTLCSDNAMVMFIEYTQYKNMHNVMHVLHTKLSERLGYPVSICHNHPTDESVLIHSTLQDNNFYFKDYCCKEDTIRCCLHYLETRKGYRIDIQVLALLAESIYERSDSESVVEILSNLNWNEDPLPQLIRKDYGF